MNLNVRKMNKNIVLLLLFTLPPMGCDGQANKQTSKVQPADCNRTVYVSSQFIKPLPPYICIPGGFIIDDYVRTSDLDGDGQTNFLAIKYNKKEDDQNDGDTTYWRFYSRSKSDSLFSLKMTLSNIVPPFVKKLSGGYLQSHPTAMKLVEEYPLRLKYHSLSFQVNHDTIRLSYKIEDTYGKSFVFVYDQANWYLQNVEYFIGELPMYWWRESDFYYPLNDKLKVIETRIPDVKVSISDFDLRTAFKYRDIEWMHLAEWHIDRVDKTKWSSIYEVEFGKCHGIDLPDDWVY
jgi:hypothetical protein